MKIRKLTNEEIKGACAFAVSIYNIAIRGCFRTQDSHRYFDEYMDADRLTDEERTGVLVVFGAFDSNVLCGVCGMTNEQTQEIGERRQAARKTRSKPQPNKPVKGRRTLY
jgi:hypothetical protein